MKLAGEYVFAAPITEVWKAILDPVVLAATMPGCEKLEIVDGSYLGELNIKVGPVQGKFTGKIDLSDIVENKGYTIKVDGRGAPGFVQATAKVSLEAQGAETKIAYDADANVGGKIASVGQRLLETSAKAIIKQSLEGLNENVKLRAAAAAAAQAVPASPSPSPSPSPSEAPMPVVKVDQSKLAAAVAKEVTKSLMPQAAMWVAIAVAVLVAFWLLFLRAK